VVSTPLKKKYSQWEGLFLSIYGKIKYVLNHQPVDEYGTMVGFYSHSYGLEWKV
jgi:hypothetical protein